MFYGLRVNCFIVLCCLVGLTSSNTQLLYALIVFTGSALCSALACLACPASDDWYGGCVHRVNTPSLDSIKSHWPKAFAAWLNRWQAWYGQSQVLFKASRAEKSRLMMAFACSTSYWSHVVWEYSSQNPLPCPLRLSQKQRPAFSSSIPDNSKSLACSAWNLEQSAFILSCDGLSMSSMINLSFIGFWSSSTDDRSTAPRARLRFNLIKACCVHQCLRVKVTDWR